MFNIKSSFIIAVLFTFTLIGTSFAQGKMMHDRKENKGQFLKKLNLTQEQKDQLSDLKFKHQKEMVDLRADLKKNLIDLKEVKSKDNFSRDEVINAVKKVNESRDKITVARANNMYDFYSLLKPEQKQMWKENQNNRDFMGCRMSHGKFPNKRMPLRNKEN